MYNTDRKELPTEIFIKNITHGKMEIVLCIECVMGRLDV
jgi:hypothetical protein